MNTRNHRFAGTEIAIIALSLTVPARFASAAPSALDGAASASAESAALVVRGETAARAGHPGEAWDLFGRAWKVDRANGMAVRWICRLALTFGPPEAASGACREAFLLGRQPEDMRNRVVAWVAGPLPPTMEDLVSATFMADGAVRTAPREPWGYLARADIALRLRDRDLLDASLGELARIAPEHPQTKRVMTLAAPRASIGVRIGRLAIVLSLALTIAHLLWTRRPSSLRRRRLASIAAIAALLLFSSQGAAQAASRGPSNEGASEPLKPPALPTIDDAHIDESLKKAEGANPLVYGDALMVLIDRAQKATEHGDHAAAARYWTAVTHAVPDRAYGYARLCASAEAAGSTTAALDACRTAITRDGSTVGDYTHFVRILLAKNDGLTADDRRQVEIAIAALAEEPKAAADAAELQADLAVRDGDVPALRASAAKLATLAPDSPKTIFYRWTLALDAHDRSAAVRLLERARETHVKPDVLARMEAATLGLPLPPAARVGRWGLVGAAAFLVAISLRAAAARVRLRPRLGPMRADSDPEKDLGRVF